MSSHPVPRLTLLFSGAAEDSGSSRNGRRRDDLTHRILQVHEAFQTSTPHELPGREAGIRLCLHLSRRLPHPIGIKAALYRHIKEHLMQHNKIKKTDPDKRFRRVLSASTLEGDTVRNPAGDNLGKVDEIMIDIPSGQVAYVVLSFGGVMGLGDKLFAVPWSALRVDEDEKCFILDVSKSTLESAPGFNKDNWPDMSNTTWATEVYTHYGVAPYWEEEQKTFRGGGGV
jgi:sporulation protein YlmC with PRC-barrel domain